MAAPTDICLNLGGEGEEKDAINQQPEWVATPSIWPTITPAFAQQIGQGEAVLFCKNMQLPFPDASVDRIFTNSVPIDQRTWLGPGVQSSEVHRVLRKGGEWLVNGVLVYRKP